MDGLDLLRAPPEQPRLDSPAHLNAGVYHYDGEDRAFLPERIAEFARQVERRIAGQLTEDEFKPLRLMNGLYLQLHAYMLRVAIPYGVLSAVQLRQLAMIAERYDRGYGHFTTRQNIQYNWTELARAPAMLAALADADMHAMQTSGNCIRNVTTDEYAGAAADEIVDPRVYAEILRQWSTLHPEFSFLPRKFKIAITGAASDRAAVQVHDIGLVACRGADGGVGFRVYVGGGLGRVPILGFVIREFVAEADLLGYLEAILRVYNARGGRENIHKARIKILVRDLGHARFTEAVEGEYAAVPRETYRLDPAIVDDIRAHFATPELREAPGAAEALAQDVARDPAFGHWVARNVRDHRRADYACALISLKPIGGIPGDATAEQMRAVADLADRHSSSEIRVSHEQNLVLPHVPRDQLYALWRRWSRRGSRPPTPGSSATSSPAPAWTTARWPTHARSRSRNASPSGMPTWTANATSAPCTSTSRAASMLAATTMSATSASWASTSRGRNTTRSPSGVRPTTPPPSASSSGRRCRRMASSIPSRRS